MCEGVWKWLVGVLVALGAGAAAVLAIFRWGKRAERTEIHEELQQRADDAETATKEGKEHDHQTITDIAVDPDPEHRDERLDKWLGEGVE